MIEEFVPLVVAASMVWTTLSFIKLLRAGKMGDALTVLVLVIIGVGVAFLAAESSYAEAFNLAAANAADKVFVGFGFSATARTGYEFKKSFDGSDSANEPKLFSNPPA